MAANSGRRSDDSLALSATCDLQAVTDKLIGHWYCIAFGYYSSSSSEENTIQLLSKCQGTPQTSQTSCWAPFSGPFCIWFLYLTSAKEPTIGNGRFALVRTHYSEINYWRKTTTTQCVSIDCTTKLIFNDFPSLPFHFVSSTISTCWSWLCSLNISFTSASPSAAGAFTHPVRPRTFLSKQ